VGMRRAAEILVQNIRATYGVSMTLHEADALLNAHRPVLSIADGDVQIGDLVAQALDATAANMVSFVEGLWGNARQWRYVIFGGGGVEIPRIRRAISQLMPHAIILPEPVTANAIGLARLAQRQFGRG